MAALSSIVHNTWHSYGRHGAWKSRRSTRTVARTSLPESYKAPQPQRLFSTLNPSTLKHEPGSVWGSGLLIAGTTVGAGILALPATTQEAGFVASSAALLGCCCFSVITGLLIAEVNIRTSAQQGAGGISYLTMVERTCGRTGGLLASAAYVFLHYSLLVAYIARAGSIVSDTVGLPLAPSAAAFAVVLGLLCYSLSPARLDQLNGSLVALVVASFVALVGVVGLDVDPALLSRADWGAVVPALPVVALAFVYQNVVPVVVANLECDPAKVRSAVIGGALLPLAMFLSWDAAILGSKSLSAPTAATVTAVAPAPVQPGDTPQAATSTTTKAGPAATAAAADAAVAPPAAAMAASAEAAPFPSTSTGAAALYDPLLALQGSSPVVGPLIQAFSFLAIATSFIGFVLGLTDFLVDALKLSSGPQQPLPYALTLLPPLGLAVTFPGIFYSALDYAGTYGVMTLFGILPAVMAWNERQGQGAPMPPDHASVQADRRNSTYPLKAIEDLRLHDIECSSSSSSIATVQQQGTLAGPAAPERFASLEMVPGGKPTLIAVGVAAAGVILNQLFMTLL